MDYSALLNQVEQIITPILDNLGFELIERELILDQGRWILRLYIDKEKTPVTIADCETVSRAVEGVLDVENIVPHRYLLEVSSPGLDRPLRRPKDFEKFAGNMVDLKTRQAVDGRHHFIGILKGLSESSVVIEQEKREWLIPLDAIKKAKIKYEF